MDMSDKLIGSDWVFTSKNPEDCSDHPWASLWTHARALRGCSKRGNMPTSSDSSSSSEEEPDPNHETVGQLPPHGRYSYKSRRRDERTTPATTTTSSYVAAAEELPALTALSPVARRWLDGADAAPWEKPATPPIPLDTPEKLRAMTPRVAADAAELRMPVASPSTAPSVTRSLGTGRLDASADALPHRLPTRRTPITISHPRGAPSSSFPINNSTTQPHARDTSGMADISIFRPETTRVADFSITYADDKFSYSSTPFQTPLLTPEARAALSASASKNLEIPILATRVTRVKTLTSTENSRRLENSQQLLHVPTPLTQLPATTEECKISGDNAGHEAGNSLHSVRVDPSRSTPPLQQLSEAATPSIADAILDFDSEDFWRAPPEALALYIVERPTPRAHHALDEMDASSSDTTESDTDSASSCDLLFDFPTTTRPALMAAQPQVFLLDSGASGNYLNAEQKQVRFTNRRSTGRTIHGINSTMRADFEADAGPLHNAAVFKGLSANLVSPATCLRDSCKHQSFLLTPDAAYLLSADNTQQLLADSDTLQRQVASVSDSSLYELDMDALAAACDGGFAGAATQEGCTPKSDWTTTQRELAEIAEGSFESGWIDSEGKTSQFTYSAERSAAETATMQNLQNMSKLPQTQEGGTPEGWLPSRQIRQSGRQSPEIEAANDCEEAKRPGNNSARESQRAKPPSTWAKVAAHGIDMKDTAATRKPLKFTVLKRKKRERGLTLADYLPGGRRKDPITTLHQRLGHATLDTMKEAVKNGDAKRMGLNITQKQINACDQIPCDTCRRSRLTRKSFPKNTKQERIEKRPDTIHAATSSDTAGPRRKRSMVITNRYGHKAGNNKHWQIAMDHYSRFLWAVAVKVKSSIPKYMKRMEIQMEIDGRHSVHATPPGQPDLKPQLLRTDNAGELLSKKAMKDFLRRKKERQLTVPGKSIQNPAEPAIKTVQDCMRRIMADAQLGLRSWELALHHAIDLVNMAPCAANPDGKSRWEMFYGKPPPWHLVKTFGADVVLHLPIKDRKHGDKQMPSGRGGRGRYRYIGIPKGTKGFLILDTQATLPNGELRPRVYVRRDVHINEDMTQVHALFDTDSSSESSSEYTDSSDETMPTSSDELGSDSDSDDSDSDMPPLRGFYSASSSGDSDTDYLSDSDSDSDFHSAMASSSSDSEGSDSSRQSLNSHASIDELFSADSGDEASDEQDLPRGRLITTRSRDTMNKVAKRHKTNVRALCRVNAFPDGQALPTSTLRTGTQLYLPTAVDLQQQELLDNISSSSSPEEGDESEGEDAENSEHPDDEEPAQAPDPIERAQFIREMRGNGPLGLNNIAAALKCSPGTAEKLYWRFKGMDKCDEGETTPLTIEEAQAEQLQHQLKEACMHAGLPCEYYKKHANKKLKACLQVCKDAARQLHSTRHASATKRASTLKQCKDMAFYCFVEAYQIEKAYLVDKLKHLRKSDVPEPKTIREALQGDFQEFWNEAIVKELKQMEDYNVWHWEHPPRGRKIVDTKWVLKIKGNNEGLIDRFKARLVARGFKGVMGIDYWRTHASVVRKESVRLVVAHAAKHDLLHHTMDIAGAFLESDIDRKVFVNVEGEGLEALKPPEPGMKLCLDKSLYGIKQAPRQWYLQFSQRDLVDDWGWTRHKHDPCLIMKRISATDYCIICLYVDDTSMYHPKGSKVFSELLEQVGKKYSYSCRDDADVFLGLRIRRTHPFHYSIDQERFVLDAAQTYGFPSTAYQDTPSSKARRDDPLTKHDCPATDAEKEEMTKYPYRGLIGTLRHLEQWTRPDISCALNILSTYQANPGKKHWKELKHLFEYVIGTRRYALHYGVNANMAAKSMEHDLSGPLTGFVDADWAGCRDTRLSRTGFVFFSNNGAISWRSRKQTTTALSTCEAEFMAASDAGCENLFLRWMHTTIANVVHQNFDAVPPTELGGALVKTDIDNYMKDKAAHKEQRFSPDERPVSVPQSDLPPTILGEDNTGAIHTSNNPTLHKRMKHVDIKVHRIREFVQEGTAKLWYVPTARQIGDIMTKNLGPQLFKRFRDCLVQQTNTDPLVLLARGVIVSRKRHKKQRIRPHWHQ